MRGLCGLGDRSTKVHVTVHVHALSTEEIVDRQHHVPTISHPSACSTPKPPIPPAAAVLLDGSR